MPWQRGRTNLVPKNQMLALPASTSIVICSDDCNCSDYAETWSKVDERAEMWNKLEFPLLSSDGRNNVSFVLIDAQLFNFIVSVIDINRR